jgi:SAM-dependent methyltransferase
MPTKGPDRTGDLSAILERFWYYSVELTPGVFVPTVRANNYASPRHALSHVDVHGLRCLDIGTMEGLIPALWARNGARQVVALDSVAYCINNVDVLKKFHDVSFDYLLMPSKANVFDFLNDVQWIGNTPDDPNVAGYREFDVVNLSGVLYHVWSPLHWLASCRPLVREGGLLFVSTHLLRTDYGEMRFNTRGRYDLEADTFWHISPSLFEYVLGLLALKPIYIVGGLCNNSLNKDDPSVYVTVVCRALDKPIIPTGDAWMELFLRDSLEYKMYHRTKTYVNPGFVKYKNVNREAEAAVSITDFVQNAKIEIRREFMKFNYTLGLADRE